MNLGKTVRTFRKQNGYSQSDFAELVGMTQPALSLLESGKSGLYSKHRTAICKHLGLTEFILQALSAEKEDMPTTFVSFDMINSGSLCVDPVSLVVIGPLSYGSFDELLFAPDGITSKPEEFASIAPGTAAKILMEIWLDAGDDSPEFYDYKIIAIEKY